MAIIHDDEWRLGELLHATPLRPGEYVWGKFVAVLAGSTAVLVLHLAAMVFFFHVLPDAKAQEFRGPFHALNYLRPALVFAMPALIFLAGLSFLAGERTRLPAVVFLLLPWLNRQMALEAAPAAAAPQEAAPAARGS